MAIKDKVIDVGAERLADVLLSLRDTSPELKKKLDIVFASLDGDPKKIVSLIKKEIFSFKRSSRFIDYYESTSFAKKLDQLRQSIINNLSPESSKHAKELMINFLDLHEKTINRADDSSGYLGGIFAQACENLGRLYANAPSPTEEVAEFVFNKFKHNGYGIYNNIISDFSNALGEEGLDLLKQKIENLSSPKHSTVVSLGLQNIADCQGDVEAYIRACAIGGKLNDNDRMKIAARFIKNWKAEDALKWLNEIKMGDGSFCALDFNKLKIEALELNGNYKEAQVLRLSWFSKRLSPQIYGEILKHSKAEFKEQFRLDALKQAFSYSDIHTALDFLAKIQEFEEVAKLAKDRLDQIDGENYYTLRPIADILKNIFPLISTLLYRKLAEPVLEKTKSRYYNYAAKDVVVCGVLAPKISDWENYMNHNDYFNSLKEKHKRKVRFWSVYQAALQKEMTKRKCDHTKAA